MHTFPLAFTGSGGSISFPKLPNYLDHILEGINTHVDTRLLVNATSVPVSHNDCQLYHRSRVIVQRRRAVQDLNMGFFVPRMTFRHYKSRAALNALYRIKKPNALELNGQASERRFFSKLADTPQGIRFETVISMQMDLFPETSKTWRLVENDH